MSTSFKAAQNLGLVGVALLLGLTALPAAAQAPLFIDFQNQEYTVNEGEIAEIQVAITAAPGAGNSASVHYATGGLTDTATPSLDYTPQSGTLFFGETTTTVSIFIPTVLDDRIECNETVTITLSNPVGAALGTQNNPATLIIKDEAAPTATVAWAEAIRDSEALVPLMDWVPLVSFSIGTPADKPAFRRVSNFEYRIKPDGFPTPPRPYDTDLGQPPRDTIQEFCLFQDYGPDGKPDGKLNEYDQFTGITWDNTGAPYGTENDGYYSLNFFSFYLGTPNGPWPGTCPCTDPPQWILAMRTSPYWFNLETLSADLYVVRLLDRYGDFPRNCDTGDPLDSYPADPMVSKLGYSSSFNVFDMTSGPSMPRSIRTQFNAWNWPNFMYTPTGEFIRPRYDKPGNFVDMVTGEWLDLRNIFALETWMPVIGINAHSSIGGATSSAAELDEVNVILTDIGADPLIPGSGGLDPRTGLDPVTTEGNVFDVDSHSAVGNSYSFNGLWVYHDTNGNGLFDPPTTTPDAGITFTDFPMYPAFRFKNGAKSPVVSGIHEWEYVSFPPDGGDPWWKMKLQFGGGRRRNPDETPTGYLDPTPDPAAPTYLGSMVADYFVVVRPDSGYQDVSLLPGDGTGMPPGTDFRAFIEPRRYNAQKGTEDGGIHFSSQRPRLYDSTFGVNEWQNDPLWTASEPWWPQRTQNPNNTKPVRNCIEVHDLVITYSTNNNYASITDIPYDYDSFFDSLGLPYGGFLGFRTTFDRWLDPFGLLRSQFYYQNSVGVVNWQEFFYRNYPGNVSVYADDVYQSFQFPYETAPFFNSYFDGVAIPPRSVIYTNPPAQPTLPEYATWPQNLAPGAYPQASDWTPENRKARILHQHVEPNGEPTAMLGFNLVGTDDPVTNRIAPMALSQVNIAFYGPDFVPTDFQPLHAGGTLASSGVLLYEDSDNDGIFGGRIGGDRVVPLKGLAWRTTPEKIDLDGDNNADDLNGDGVVDDLDRAWVLTITPNEPWPLPLSDERTEAATDTTVGGKSVTAGDQMVAANNTGGALAGSLAGPASALNDAPGPGRKTVSQSPTDFASTRTVHTIDLDAVRAEAQKRAELKATSDQKAIGGGAHEGDDLFLVVQTSNTVRRFEQFKALIPSTLPDRTASARAAGIKLVNSGVASSGAFIALNPEEGAVQDYYKYNYMEVTTPTEIVDLTSSGQTITKNSAPTAVLGIDSSTGRGAAAVAATGPNGVGALKSLSVPGATWTPGAMIGYWLIDGNYESFQITANSATTLTLLSGTPKSGFYRIEKDPTFLELVTVELYDEGNDGSFKLQDDLEPLDIDQTKSGVALYRDNDQNPANRNGKFDPGIDIPVQLDFAPYLSGLAGEPPVQIRFVFSTPGTDNLGTRSISAPLANQPRHRQWIPDSSGTTSSDPDSGPDFFVVLRTSNAFEIGDDFRVGIVSWGPNTPTEPDPDTFPPYPVSLHPDEFDIFSEFPWGSRAIGYITFFKDPTKLVPPDLSGFNWIRSTVSQAQDTQIVTGIAGGDTAVDAVVINSASRSVLPTLVGPNGLSFTISGSGFGTAPLVTLNGISLIVTSATNTLIAVTIPPDTAIVDTPVILKVTNTVTTKFAVRDDLFTLTTDPIGDEDVVIDGAAPGILPQNVPSQGVAVSIFGSGFGTTPKVKLQGFTLIVNSATDTLIQVTIPGNTHFASAPLSLTVSNPASGKEATRDDLFAFATVPSILTVNPNRGPSSVFPVTITGSGFDTPTVYFGKTLTSAGGTLMPVLSWSATEISVGFPSGGLPDTGELDVKVVNASTTYALKEIGFFYENEPVKGPPRACFIATAAYGTSFENHLTALRGFRDSVLLKSALGAALVDTYYTTSPAVADVVADHSWMAWLVRVVLTPIVWALESPALAVGTCLALAMAVCLGYYRRRRFDAGSRGGAH